MSNKITKREALEFKQNPEKTKEYSTGEVTVYWRPELCIHYANCLMGLPGVFNTRKRPWINVNGGSTIEIIQTVDTCPSRALTYLKNPKYNTPRLKKKSRKPAKFARIQLLKDGPYMISGNFIIRDANKKKVKVSTEVVALCGCGASNNKPFCDATHMRQILNKG